MAPKSSEFASTAERAEKFAKRAIVLAREQKRTDLMISALCTVSQSQYLSGEKHAARQAAVSAGSLARRSGDRLGEAMTYAECLSSRVHMSGNTLFTSTLSQRLDLRTIAVFTSSCQLYFRALELHAEG
ncbi:unnamed protein product [Symbiodinium microadriaticum]|nr:unnamed protein product [Symbiodinium microadriaticum]